MSLLTPDNLPGVLTAIGTILAALGGWTFVKARREPPKPGTPDAAASALAENTRATLAMVDAMKSQNAHFEANNDMFKALGPVLADMKRDGAESRVLLARICDALNRRG